MGVGRSTRLLSRAAGSTMLQLLLLLGLLAAASTAPSDAVPEQSVMTHTLMGSAVASNGLNQDAVVLANKQVEMEDAPQGEARTQADVSDSNQMKKIENKGETRTQATGRSTDTYPAERYDEHVVLSVKTSTEIELDDLQRLFKSGEVSSSKVRTQCVIRYFVK